MIRITRYTFFFILTLSSFAFAQRLDTIDAAAFIQNKRVEYEVTPQDSGFEIVKGDEESLLVVRETRIRSADGHLWGLYHLNRELQELWKVDVNIVHGMTFLGHDFNGESFFLLFAKNEYRLEELFVIRIDKLDGAVNSYHVNTVLPMTLSHFEVIGHSLIFGGNSNNRPVVLFYQLEENKPQVLPGIYNNRSEIVDVITNDEKGIFTVVLNERSQSKDLIVSLKVFSEDGKKLYASKLETVYEKSLIDGIPTDFEQGVQYVAGTYSHRNSDISRGLYLAKLINGEQEFIKYHNYGDLDNFFSYLNDNQETRVKRRIEKKKDLGKKIKLNYRLMVHDIVKRGDEYILIGEAYYPKYSNTTAVQGNMNSTYQNLPSGQPIYTQPKLLGYNYTHAIVVGFDKNGDILWDNSFEINDVLVFPLIENVQVSVDEDKIILMYAFDNSLKTKIIQGDSVLEGKAINDIALKYENDEVKDSVQGMEGIKWWYGTKFYAYGIQKIKNMADDDVKLNRKVFYLNKVEF